MSARRRAGQPPAGLQEIPAAGWPGCASRGARLVPLTRSATLPPLCCSLLSFPFLSRDHFHGQLLPHACYAHAWDASGSRLFSCGGPLAFGLRGCYMALWE